MDDAAKLEWNRDREAEVAAEADGEPGGAQRDRDQLDELEAYRQLEALARRRLRGLPAARIAAHLVEVTHGGDWPLRLAAFDAVSRRWSFARSDGLVVAGRPRGKRVLGAYTTRRTGERGKRPYSTLLRSLEPLAGSCDCPDFRRSSLGLCKHLLVVLARVAGSDDGRLLDALERARKQQRRQTSSLPSLRWDPIRPLVGVGDWMQRLRWVNPDRARPGRPARALLQARRWFVRSDGALDRPAGSGAAGPPDGPSGRTAGDRTGAAGMPLAEVTGPASPQRIAVVEDLLRFCAYAERAGGGGCPVDPAVRPLLEQERGRLRRGRSARPSAGRRRRRTAARGQGAQRSRAAAGRLERAALRGFKGRLYAYQREGVVRFLEAGRLLLADDMGLGKTAQAIAAAHALHREGRVRRGLVIVPAPLKHQWCAEWQRFSETPVAVVEGTPRERAQLYRRNRSGFLVANYEQVLRDLQLMLAWSPQLVVLDEAQRIKNWATKTATYVKRLQPDYRLVLTGTPMENRLEELASIMDWVDRSALDPVWRLEPWHTLRESGGHGVAGARNLDTLRARLAPSMVRRLRSDVLEQHPKRTDITVPVELTAAQRVEHEALDPAIARIARAGQRRPLTQAEFLRLMQLLTMQRIICNGLALRDFAEVWPDIEPLARPSASLLDGMAAPKLLELRELVGQLLGAQKRKVVIFSQWRRMLRLAHWALAPLLRAAGAHALYFTGAESQRRRTQNLVAFHDDPAAAVLFSPPAGGVGVNLQRAASCCINLELPWNPAVLEQRIGRIYRLGQRDPIDVYNLVSNDGIEARIARLVSSKQQLFVGLFDGTSDTLAFDQASSFLSRVAEIVDPSALDASAGVDEPEELETDGELGLQRQDEDVWTDDVPASPDGEAAPLARAEPGDSRDRTVQTDGASGSAAAAGTAGAVGAATWLSQLRVHPEPDGGLTISAPPEAAAGLAAIFSTLAEQLAAAATPAPSAEAPGAGVEVAPASGERAFSSSSGRGS